MTFTEQQKDALNAPLDPRHVKPPPQGKYGEYVDSHHVLSEANRIFDFAWSYEITSMAQCSRVEGQDRNGKPQVRVAYRCTVKAMINGIYREGAAVGTGMAKPENEGDAHESAVKEAETDALKRALRSFGNTFGLALYDKTKSNVQAPPPPTITDEQRTEIMALCTQTGVNIADVLKAGNIADTRDIPADQFNNVRQWILTQAQKKKEPS